MSSPIENNEAIVGVDGVGEVMGGEGAPVVAGEEGRVPVYRGFLEVVVPPMADSDAGFVVEATAPIVAGVGAIPLGNVVVEVRPRVVAARTPVVSPKQEKLANEARERIAEAKDKVQEKVKQQTPRRRLAPRSPSPPGPKDESCRGREVDVELNEARLNSVARRAVRPRLTSPQQQRQQEIREQPPKKPRLSPEPQAHSSSSDSSILVAPPQVQISDLKKKVAKVEALLGEERKKSAALKKKADAYKARAVRYGVELDQAIPKREKHEKAAKEAQAEAKAAKEELLALREQPSELSQKLKDVEAERFRMELELIDMSEKFDRAMIELEDAKKRLEAEKEKAAKAEQAAARIMDQMREMGRRQLSTSPADRHRHPSPIERADPRPAAGRSTSSSPPSEQTPEPAASSLQVSTAEPTLEPKTPSTVTPDFDNMDLDVDMGFDPMPGPMAIREGSSVSSRSTSTNSTQWPPSRSPSRSPSPPPSSPQLFYGPGQCPTCSTRISQKTADRRAMAARIAARAQPVVDVKLQDQMQEILAEVDELNEHVQRHVKICEATEKLIDPEVSDLLKECHLFQRHLTAVLNNPRRLESSRNTSARRLERLKAKMESLDIPTDHIVRVPPPIPHVYVDESGMTVNIRARSSRAAAVRANWHFNC